MCSGVHFYPKDMGTLQLAGKWRNQHCRWHYRDQVSLRDVTTTPRRASKKRNRAASREHQQMRAGQFDLGTAGSFLGACLPQFTGRRSTCAAAIYARMSMKT
jgi:hypothetical protein